MNKKYIFIIVALCSITFAQINAQLATFSSTGSTTMAGSYATRVTTDMNPLPAKGAGITLGSSCTSYYGAKFTQPLTTFSSSTMNGSSFDTRLVFRCYPTTSAYALLVNSISIKIRKPIGSPIKFRIGYSNNNLSYVDNGVDLDPTETVCDANIESNTIEQTWDMDDFTAINSSKLNIRLYLFNATSQDEINIISLKVNGVVITPAVLSATSAVSEIGSSSATSGGDITSDGGSTVTARGVCWNTVTAPTIALSSKTTDATGTGLFTSRISGLTANTLYYVRSYATTSFGTAYGQETSFTTLGSSSCYIAASANNAYGAVDGAGVKGAGTEVSLTATPASSSYRFVNWTEGGSPVSTENPYTFTASTDRVLYANFEEDLGTKINNTTNDKQDIIILTINNQIVIDCESAISSNSSVSVYNSLGQIILTQQLKDKNTTLNATRLKGVYLVSVKNGDRIITKKIAIN